MRGFSVLGAGNQQCNTRQFSNPHTPPLMFSKLILLIGPPCSGKGLLGKCFSHVYTDRSAFGVVTMRQLLDAKKAADPTFAALMASGDLIPDTEIFTLFKEMGKYFNMPGDGGTLVLDGAPRTAAQVGMLQEVFQGVRTFVIESQASNKYLRDTFLVSVDAPDRQGREDADPCKHEKRVALYREHLPSITDTIKSKTNWVHRRHRAEANTIQQRMNIIRMVAKLPAFDPSLMATLEVKPLPFAGEYVPQERQALAAA